MKIAIKFIMSTNVTNKRHTNAPSLSPILPRWSPTQYFFNLKQLLNVFSPTDLTEGGIIISF